MGIHVFVHHIVRYTNGLVEIYSLVKVIVISGNVIVNNLFVFKYL